jgi:hypothetical protein
MDQPEVSPESRRAVNHRAILLIGVLAVVLAALLAVSPEEETLGKVVKVVYLHGAMVRTAILLLVLALPLHLLALAGRGGAAGRWGAAATGAGTVVWMVHTVLRIVTTYAAWGILIAWNEPRTRFTFAIAAFSLLVAVAARLLQGERLAHLPPALLSASVLAIIPRLGFLQHPIDPIGRSTSAEIRCFYVAILAVSALIGLALTWCLGSTRR